MMNYYCGGQLCIVAILPF